MAGQVHGLLPHGLFRHALCHPLRRDTVRMGHPGTVMVQRCPDGPSFSNLRVNRHKGPKKVTRFGFGKFRAE